MHSFYVYNQSLTSVSETRPLVLWLRTLDFCQGVLGSNPAGCESFLAMLYFFCRGFHVEKMHEWIA